MLETDLYSLKSTSFYLNNNLISLYIYNEYKMKKATKNDRIVVEQIIIEAFRDNPNINFMIRPSADKEKMLKRLAQYVFDFALKREGIFITSDSKGLVICCEQPIKMDLEDYFNQFKLILGAIKLRNIGNIFHRNAYINSIRPNKEKAIYLWCVALSNTVRGHTTANEIKNFVFEKATQAQLPIYVETALWKHKIAYERYGFETYHYWESAGYRLKTWFLKKKVNPFLLTDMNYMQ